MKMRLLFSFLLLIFCGFVYSIQAQTIVTGEVVEEESMEPVQLAGIKILNRTDSTFVQGAVTNDKGKFSLSVPKGEYILQVFYLGYADAFKNIRTNSQRNNVGTIMLSTDAILLSEAVVIGKAPDMVVKGDTVEYNADSYKVQESAVLGDLIKRIPGAEVDANGKITINGKDISKILVDGKEFFSDDPTTASQNLPARIIEKLQVLDKKSDMSQLTGFDDGEEETVINLTLKPGMKTGLISNVTMGMGSEDRYEGNGFINYAINNTRISAFGNFNNNNNVNAANADSRSSNRGLKKTSEGGANFAMEPSSKFKLDGDLYYGRTDTDLSSQTNTEYIGVTRSQKGDSKSNKIDEQLRFRFRMEWNPDSLTRILFRPRMTYSTGNSLDYSSTSTIHEGVPRNNVNRITDNSSRSNNLSLNGFFLINRKLNSEGRNISLSFGGGLTDNESRAYNYTEETYSLLNDSTAVMRQKVNQDNDNNNIRLRMAYIEPLGHNNFLQLSYSFSKRNSETDKKVHSYDDLTEDYSFFVDSLSRNTKNNFITQNITLAFQSRRQNYNYTIGMGIEPSRSKTDIVLANQETKDNKARNYFNYAPRLEFNYLWSKKHNIRVVYYGYTNEPSTLQLYDGIISQNGADKTIGNPNLKPSFTNQATIRYLRSIPESSMSMSLNANFEHTMNSIVTISRWIDGGNIKSYENINGNMSGNIRYELNAPLRNKKFTVTTTTFGRYTKDNTFVSSGVSDSQKNTSNVYRIGERARLKFNSDIFQFDLGGNFSFENAKNSLSSTLDKAVYNFGGMGAFTWYLPMKHMKLVLESDINYSSNAGYESGYKQNEWLWNASLSKQFLKDNRGTARFKIYDILQERSSVSRSSTAEYMRYTVSNTIGSYFMVSFIYRFDSFRGGKKASDMDGAPQRESKRSYGGSPRRMGF